MSSKCFLIAVMSCCLAGATGKRMHMQTMAQDLASGPHGSPTWKRWLETSGRNLGKRLMWFPTDAYEVVFDDVVLPDHSRPCSVTFIVSYDEKRDDLTLNLFAVDVLDKLLSDEDVPASGDKIFNGKVWAQSLFESKCLSLGFSRNGIGHLHGVGTRDADEYGGCGCFSQGKLLVQLADYLACKFGQSSMELSDSSEIQCRNSASVSESMTLFYTLKRGISWYESFGYEYLTKHKDAARVLRRIGDAAINWSDSDSSVKNLLAAYSNHLDDPVYNHTLYNRKFIMWIWDTHCDEWKAAVEHIYGKTSLAGIKAGSMHKAMTCE